MADALPPPLGARPGSRYLEASVDPNRLGDDHTLVALDPGDRLDRVHDLAWCGKTTGTALRATTDPRDYRDTLVETLDSRAARWSDPSPSRPIDHVTVDPSRIQRVGRASPVIDADADGLDPLSSRRLVTTPADDLAFVQEHAGRLGKRAFARLTGLPATVAERAARGKPISVRNVARALRAFQQ